MRRRLIYSDAVLWLKIQTILIIQFYTISSVIGTAEMFLPSSFMFQSAPLLVCHRVSKMYCCTPRMQLSCSTYCSDIMCEQNLPKNLPPISRVVDVPNWQSSSSPPGSSLFISGDQLGIENEANVNSGSFGGSEQIDQQPIRQEVTWSSVPPSISTLDNLPKIIPPPAPTIDRIGSIVDFQHQDYDIDEVAQTIPITKSFNGNRHSQLIIGEIGSKDEETSKDNSRSQPVRIIGPIEIDSVETFSATNFRKGSQIGQVPTLRLIVRPRHSLSTTISPILFPFRPDQPSPPPSVIIDGNGKRGDTEDEFEYYELVESPDGEPAVINLLPPKSNPSNAPAPPPSPFIISQLVPSPSTTSDEDADGSESNVTPTTTILPIDEEYEYEEEEIIPSATTINSLSSVSKIVTTTTTTPMTSIITGAQCGSAPDYLPCISEDVANVRMLSCCQSKLLPAGCLDLCRYNTTRPEVRAAFDNGRCGILQISPFLQCASAGANNIECCRTKGVMTRTGAQCEIFCNPANGLGLLGLQHFVCGTAIELMLRCHLSGIRS